MQNTHAVLEQNTGDLYTGIFALDNCFSTVPVVAVRPIYQQPDEEELHTSFEQAISERLLAVNVRLGRMATTTRNSRVSVARDTQVGNLSNAPVRVRQWSGWQLRVSLVCLAFMLVMLGFDIMGLLMLHAR